MADVFRDKTYQEPVNPQDERTGAAVSLDKTELMLVYSGMILLQKRARANRDLVTPETLKKIEDLTDMLKRKQPVKPPKIKSTRKPKNPVP
jgi:hypothetical protein